MRSIAFGRHGRPVPTVLIFRHCNRAPDATSSTMRSHAQSRAREAACSLADWNAWRTPQPERHAGPDRRGPDAGGPLGEGSEARRPVAREPLGRDARRHRLLARDARCDALERRLGGGRLLRALQARFPRSVRGLPGRRAPALRLDARLPARRIRPGRRGPLVREARGRRSLQREPRRRESLGGQLSRREDRRRALRRREPDARALRRRLRRSGARSRTPTFPPRASRARTSPARICAARSSSARSCARRP